MTSGWAFRRGCQSHSTPARTLTVSRSAWGFICDCHKCGYCPPGRGAEKAERPTTSCQLRAGIEHLFPNVADTRALTLDNVGLSFVVLTGDDHAANRFYLEDMAIGLMRPPLNMMSRLVNKEASIRLADAADVGQSRPHKRACLLGEILRYSQVSDPLTKLDSDVGSSLDLGIEGRT